MPTPARRAGRYDALRDAIDPGPALPKVRLVGRIETVIAAVPDPNPVMGEKLKRQRVAVNRRSDALEAEYSYGRISQAAYEAGRAYQDVLEAARGFSTKGCTFEPGTGGGSHEHAIATSMERAVISVETQWEVRRAIGQWSELVLRHVLEGVTVREAAAKMATPTKRGRAYILETFREGLEALAIHWERHGMK